MLLMSMGIATAGLRMMSRIVSATRRMPSATFLAMSVMTSVTRSMMLAAPGVAGRGVMPVAPQPPSAWEARSCSSASLSIAVAD